MPISDRDLALKISTLVEGAEDVRELKDELRNLSRQKVPDTTGKFRQGLDRARGLLVSFVGLLSGAALVRGITQVTQGLEDVNRQARALDSSVETVQELRFVFRQFGLDSGDVADALNTLADRAQDAIDGTKGIQEDFALAGISVEELRGKKPVELFELMADRISRIEGTSTRTSVAVRTFGDGLAQRLLPLLREGADGLREMRETAHDLGVVLDEETVEGAAEAGRQIRVLSEVFKAQFSRGIAQSSDEINELLDVLTNPDTLQAIASFTSALVSGFANAAQFVSTLVDNVEELNDTSRNNTIAQLESEAQQLRDLQGSSVLSRTGVFTLNGERQFYLSEDDIQGALDEIDARVETLRAEQSKEEKKKGDREDPVITIPPLGGGGGDGDDDAADAAEEAAEAQKEAEEALRDRIQAIEESRRSNQDLVRSLEEEIELSQLGNRERAQEIAVRRLNRDATDEQREAVRELAGRLFDLKEQAEDTTDGMSEFFAEAAREIQSSLADFLFDPFDEGLDGMLEGFRRTIQRMIAEAAAAQITDAVFGSQFGHTGEVGGLLSQGASLLGGLFGGGGFNAGGAEATASGISGLLPTSTAFAGIPGLANGGTARAGLPHIVGERGPELFIPQTTGQVVPNGQFSAGESITVENIIRTRDPDTTVQSRAVRERRAHQGLQRGRRNL